MPIPKRQLRIAVNKVLRMKEESKRSLLFELGVGLQQEYSPPGIRFAAKYLEMGKELWHSLETETYDLLCNRKSKAPQEWVSDLIDGDIRNLSLGILTAVTSKYDVSLGIAVPAVALILKSGMLRFCKSSPGHHRNTKLLLRKKQREMKKFAGELKRSKL